MKFPFLKSGALRRIAVVCILATGLPVPAQGQLNALKKVATPEEPAKPAAPEKPEDIRKRLEQWLQEARDTLARLDAPGAAAGLPEGITPEELDERRRDLEQMILTASRSHQEPQLRRRRPQGTGKLPRRRCRAGPDSPRSRPTPSS